MSERPAIFLDRDGIINRSIVRVGKPYPPFSLGEVELIPGAVNSLNKLANAGYLLIGITNQPDVARGTQTREMVETINSYIKQELPITEIFTCYHDDLDNCNCRKPKPGLIMEGAKKYKIDLAKSWMVGDRWKDILAGHAAGLRTIFVDYHYDEVYQGPIADFVIESMAGLADLILKS